MIIAAEVGLNYEGNLDLAMEMVRQAARAGADAVKFQFGWRGAPGEMNHLTPEQAVRIRRCCDANGVALVASVFTTEALALADAAELETYKLASRTVKNDPDLCRAIIGRGRPTYVSLGMWEGDGGGFPFGAPAGTPVRYIYCRSKYPTSPEDLATMPARFTPDGFWGYSDHSLGNDPCLIAAARGASYIEKHFTLNKASQTIRDHLLSATPDEFRDLALAARGIARTVAAMAGAAQ